MLQVGGEFLSAATLAAGFVHPGLALAAVGLTAIPVIIHLINRLRHRKVPWAAMRFLLAANKRSLRRIRFENWILLAVRMAAILLFGLAVARPMLAGGKLLAAGGTVRHRVIVVDNSLSACYAAPGTTSGAEAGSSGTAVLPVAAAQKLLNAFPDSDAVSLVTMAQPAALITQQPAYDRRALRNRIAAIRPTLRASDVSGALTHALKVLQESPAASGNRFIYLVSDLAREDWVSGANAEAAVRLAERAATDNMLILVPTVTVPRDNVAITSLACRDALRSIHEPVRIDAHISNFGSRPARGLQLQVRAGQRIVGSPAVADVLPGQTAATPFSVRLDAPGTHVVEVRLQGGAGGPAPGDARYLCLEVSATVPVLVVDGRPGASRFSGEAGYLATALAPAAGDDHVAPALGDSPATLTPETGLERASLLAPNVISPLELVGEALDQYRLVVLCNVPRLEGSANGGWGVLEEYVRSGGGLLIFTGDAIDLESYNRFGYSQGKGILPGRLGSPVGDPEDRESYVRLASENLDHPVLVDFQGVDRSGLFLNGRVFAYHPVDVTPPDEATSANVLLRFTNDHPAVIEKDVGQGKVCLVTTSANMRWNNLAGRGDYVTLMWALAAYLGADRPDELNRPIGKDFVHPLEPWQASTVLSGAPAILPDGSRVDAEVAVVDTQSNISEVRQHQVEYGPLEQAGPYQIQVPKAPIRFAANIEAAEADLRIATEAELNDCIKAPFSYLQDAESVNVASGESHEFSRTLMFIVMLLLGVEVWMASRLGGQK